MQPNKIDLLAYRSINGDRRSANRLFAHVMAECAPALAKFRRNFVDRDDATSAAGIAFASALREWRPWSGPFASFFVQSLSGFAKRAARDRFRHSRRIAALAGTITETDGLATPQTVIERTLDRASLLSRAAAALDGRQRDVFEAVRSGEPQTEIAARLGVSTQNINQIFSRALDRVRAELAIEIQQGT